VVAAVRREEGKDGWWRGPYRWGRLASISRVGMPRYRADQGADRVVPGSRMGQLRGDEECGVRK
jgi:hypothetical protein